MLALGLTACNPGNQCYPEAQWPNYTAYEVTVTHDTPHGIHLDDPKHELDPDHVDRVVQRVVDCLAPLKDNPLSEAERGEALCYGTPTLEVRQCLVVKMAPDWRVSKCTGEQVFPCNVPIESCTSKGQIPTVECPCSCRSIVQDNTVVLATPNMRIFPAYLTTLLTGCFRPWTARLAHCSDNSQLLDK